MKNLINNPSLIILIVALFFLGAFYNARIVLAKQPCPTCAPVDSSTYDPVKELVPPGLLSGSANATTLQSGTNSTLLQVGTESTLLQTGTESTLLQGGAEGTLLQASVNRQDEPVNILFLIDSSQSMKEKISAGENQGIKEQKMDAAKKVLQETISRIPAYVNIGLRVFGDAFHDDFSDCQATTLLVPLGKNNRRAIIEKVREIRAYGLTPLTYALMQAEQDLRYCVGPKTIILISDGVETCGGNPCAYIDKLSRLGFKLKIDIVGLGLKHDRLAQQQLGCIANKSGGQFYDANTSAELIDSITHSVRQAISGKILTKMQAPLINNILPAELKNPIDSSNNSSDK